MKSASGWLAQSARINNKAFGWSGYASRRAVWPNLQRLAVCLVSFRNPDNLEKTEAR